MTAISLKVNGHAVKAEVEPRVSLADFLRSDRHLTGTHLACEHGVCGACNVVVNGVPARSCITLAVSHDGAEVRTVEGFETDLVMSRLRDAFTREHALQCGFCTPGMLITAYDIVTRYAAADEARIRVELAGNLCRCTGYLGIVNAIQRVMRELPAAQRIAPGTRREPGETAPVGTTPFRTFVARQETGDIAGRPDVAVIDAAPAPPGWSRVADRFVVPRPCAEVWELFDDTLRMARCLPGVDLSTEDGRHLKSKIRIAFGPMKVDFDGTATLERNDADRTGLLVGEGSDARGGSRAKGRVSYRLAAEPDGMATRVDITLDYQLLGPLAQFSRSGLVQDFTRRLIAEFARNLSAQLSGNIQDAPAAYSFNAGSVMGSVLWARVKRWLGMG